MSQMFLRQYTGRGVRVAVIDSGVHAAHPHVGRVEEGVAIREDGSLDADVVDRLGHGTAVAAAIQEKAPDAAIVPIKVFWRTLATNAASLVVAIDQACARGAHVINLSLGTANHDHRAILEAAVARACARGALVVAALGDESGGVLLPGCLDGVVAVRLDWTCPREAYRLDTTSGRVTVVASAYPRDIPEVPRERNLMGISFAVANVSGFVARARQVAPAADALEILAVLAAGVSDAAAPQAAER